MAYPFRALVDGVYSELHDDLDRPQADSSNYSDDRVHCHASRGGFKKELQYRSMIKKERDEHCWPCDAWSTEEMDLCGIEDKEDDAIVTYLFADSGQYHHANVRRGERGSDP